MLSAQRLAGPQPQQQGYHPASSGMAAPQGTIQGSFASNSAFSYAPTQTSTRQQQLQQRSFSDYADFGASSHNQSANFPHHHSNRQMMRHNFPQVRIISRSIFIFQSVSPELGETCGRWVTNSLTDYHRQTSFSLPKGIWKPLTPTTLTTTISLSLRATCLAIGAYLFQDVLLCRQMLAWNPTLDANYESCSTMLLKHTIEFG